MQAYSFCASTCKVLEYMICSLESVLSKVEQHTGCIHIYAQPTVAVMAVGNDIRYICLSTEEIGDKMGEMITKIKKSLSGYALKFYEKEFAFFEEITGISGKIR